MATSSSLGNNATPRRPFHLQTIWLDDENTKHCGDVDVDGKSPRDAPAALNQDGHHPQWTSIGSKVDRIVDVISYHIFKAPAGDRFEHEGRQALAANVSRYIETNERIEFVFPAFPFKSPGRGKTLGCLPDLGEELLLRKLESLAHTIEGYYQPGALIWVVSDGAAYGELLGESDAVVYRYNTELRRLCDEFSFTHIDFLSIVDLVTNTPFSGKPITEKDYIDSVPASRSLFLQHKVSGFDLEAILKHDAATLRAYCANVKSLVKDLEGTAKILGPDGKPIPSKEQTKIRHTIAKAMLRNDAKLSDLVRLKFPHAIKLSIHAQNNAGPKYAFCMPVGDMSHAPWHNVVKEEVDGTLNIAPRHSVDSSRYYVVHRYGRPYYLRAHSTEYDLGDKINPHVEFIRNQPLWIIIKGDPMAKLRYDDLSMDKVRKLALRYSLLVFQGFSPLDKDTFGRVVEGLGEVVHCAHGELGLKEDATLNLNGSMSYESLAKHHDGMFKTNLEEKLQTLMKDSHALQMPLCAEVPKKAEADKALLTNAAAWVLRPKQCPWLSRNNFTTYTPATDTLKGNRSILPFLTRNGSPEHNVLRWHGSRCLSTL